MKKFMIATVFVVASSVVVGSEQSAGSEQTPKESSCAQMLTAQYQKPSVNKLASNLVSTIKEHQLMSSMVAFAALNAYLNGTKSCPISKEARNIGAAVAGTSIAYKAWNSQHPVTKYGVSALSAAVAGVSVVEIVKNRK